MAEAEDHSDMTPISRPAARVVLIDAKDRCLLFRWKPPNVWITLGGGLEASATYEQAALRELWEETGLTGVELGPWVWSRTTVFKWRGVLYEAHEQFYLIRVQEHTVSLDGLDSVEVEEMTEYKWWSTEEILAAKDVETFASRRLGELLPPLIAGKIPPVPIETGT